MRTRPLFASLQLAVAACSSDVTTPPLNPVVTLSATSAWSGDTIALASNSFVGSDSVPLVLAGADTLVVHHVGDSVSVVLPDTNGVITLAVVLRDGGRSSVDVHVFGYDTAFAAPDLDGAATGVPWHAGGPTRALGIQHGRLVIVDYAGGTATQAAPDTTLGDYTNTKCGVYEAPMPSLSDPGLVVVPLGCGPWAAIPFNGSGSAADSAPANAGSTLSFWVHLDRGKWLQIGDVQHTYSWNGSSFDVDTGVWGGRDASGVALSPRRDRIVPEYVIGTASGSAVYGRDGAVAFWAAGSTGGAAFSPGGDTLFRTINSAYPYHLAAYDATSGAALNQGEIPTWQMGVAVDSARPYLYLSNGGNVFVYDRLSLHQVAVLRTHMLPPGTTADLYVDPVGRHLYVVPDRLSISDPTSVHRFDLMP